VKEGNAVLVVRHVDGLFLSQRAMRW